MTCWTGERKLKCVSKLRIPEALSTVQALQLTYSGEHLMLGTTIMCYAMLCSLESSSPDPCSLCRAQSGNPARALDLQACAP